MSSRPRRDPWIALPLLMIGGPLLAGLMFMLAYSTGLIGLLAQGFTLRHWAAALADGQTWMTLGYSVWIGAASLGASLILALVLQAVLGSRLTRGALHVLLFVPLAVPPLVAALLSVEVLGNAGLLARLTRAFGWLDRPDEFPNLLYGRSGLAIVLTHMALVTPFLMLLLDRLAHNERVADVAQVARALGASRWQAWRRITVPILMRAAAPVLSVYFLALMGAFEVPLIVGSQYPAMISVLIQRRLSQFDMTTRPEAYVLATLYGGLAVGLLLAFFAARRRRERLELRS
ncbi:MAG: ABC transporter permease subunit [Gammaproteobacteria bacterium]